MKAKDAKKIVEYIRSLEGCFEYIYAAIEKRAKEGKTDVSILPKTLSWHPYEYDVDSVRDAVVEKLRADGFRVSFEFPEPNKQMKYGICIDWE